MRNVHETDPPTEVQGTDSDGNFRSFPNQKRFQLWEIPQRFLSEAVVCVLFIFTVIFKFSIRIL